MTKSVRVENACNSNFKMIVEVWDKGYPVGTPDKLVKSYNLDYPTQMTPPELYITSSRYLIVKEV